MPSDASATAAVACSVIVPKAAKAASISACSSSLADREDYRQKAVAQLGTVGSGNHYVDVFADESGATWIGVHFGSRGFGCSALISGGTAGQTYAVAFGWAANTGETDSRTIYLDVEVR